MTNRLNLSFVQFAPEFGEVERNLKTAFRLSSRAKEGIIVLPELFNTGYAFNGIDEVKHLAEPIGGRTSDAILDISRKTKSTVVAGFAERNGKKFYNSAMIASKGKFIGIYRKLHLFYREKTWFSPGNMGLQVFDVNGIKVGIMICFDWIFPEVARTLALKGAVVIAHPSNLILKGLCQQVMLARSIENRVFTITANRIGVERRGGEIFRYTGLSQIVNPQMDIIARAGVRQEVVKSVTVDIEDAKNKIVFKKNDLFLERRIDDYSIILEKY